MWKDSIVEKVRKTREKILIDANYDISKVLNEIKEMQIKDKDKLVSFVEKKT
jgi:hypothetical protein